MDGPNVFELLKAEAMSCTRCALARTRTNVVFGVGNPAADLLFVGEAPGFHEDAQGEPFVGRAGQLLTTMLGEIGLAREDVYIANILKCRPPGNRDPLPAEIQECTPFLDRQIACIRPSVVATLGNFATRYLLGTALGITRLRGRRYRYREAVLIPTLHPAAVLRGGAARVQEMRDDFALVRRSIDAAHPKPQVRRSSEAPVATRPPTDREETSRGAVRLASQPGGQGFDEAANGDPDVEQLGLF